MTVSRVLLVDDESCMLDSLSFLLELEGFTIAGAATDLAAAMELAASVEADIAILDIYLRRQLVYPAADALLARGIPILFLSGRPADLPPRFKSATFLEKLCLPEVLIAHIEGFSSQAHATRRAADQKFEASAGRLFGELLNAGTERLAPRLEAPLKI